MQRPPAPAVSKPPPLGSGRRPPRFLKEGGTGDAVDTAAQKDRPAGVSAARMPGRAVGASRSRSLPGPPPGCGVPRAHPGRGLPCPVSVTPQCSLPKGLGSTAGRTFRLEPRTRAASWRQRRGPRDACVPGGPREHGAGCLCAVGTSSRAALGLTRQLGEDYLSTVHSVFVVTWGHGAWELGTQGLGA